MEHKHIFHVRKKDGIEMFMMLCIKVFMPYLLSVRNKVIASKMNIVY